jgi:hypothetical protein
MKLRLSKTQREVLTAICKAEPFCEYLTPDRSRLFFRTLGPCVRARLNYILAGKRVRYETFWFLFKHNLIRPGRYKGSPSPQDGITQFYPTVRGQELFDTLFAKKEEK